MTKQFCVYIHKRPNGEPFYIGKGLVSRAYDFAPSRRTTWHKNIVEKYGRNNIDIEVILCDTETAAFELEVKKIAWAKENNYCISNLTNGGEGASGRKATQKQIDGLNKGRLKGKKGTKGARPHLEKWIRSDAGQAHVKRLSKIGKENLHKERKIACKECNVEFITKSAKAKCCSRLCEQRNRRSRQKNARN